MNLLFTVYKRIDGAFSCYFLSGERTDGFDFVDQGPFPHVLEQLEVWVRDTYGRNEFSLSFEVPLNIFYKPEQHFMLDEVEQKAVSDLLEKTLAGCKALI